MSHDAPEEVVDTFATLQQIPQRTGKKHKHRTFSWDAKIRFMKWFSQLDDMTQQALIVGDLQNPFGIPPWTLRRWCDIFESGGKFNQPGKPLEIDQALFEEVCKRLRDRHEHHRAVKKPRAEPTPPEREPPSTAAVEAAAAPEPAPPKEDANHTKEDDPPAESANP